MLPIRDHNPSLRPAIITVILIVACVAVFIYQWQLGQSGSFAIEALIFEYGFIPGEFFSDPMAGEIPEAVTIFTSMFLHGDILHLAGNMLFLWIFGDNIEDAMGGFRFLIFYLICGVAAALTQGYVDPDSAIPMIGASGAISGVLGAYLFLYPFHKIDVFVGAAIIQIPAIIVLMLYMGVQLYYGFTMPVDQPGVAFWAHIGGFAAGAVLHRLFCLPRRY